MSKACPSLNEPRRTNLETRLCMYVGICHRVTVISSVQHTDGYVRGNLFVADAYATTLPSFSQSKRDFSAEGRQGKERKNPLIVSFRVDQTRLLFATLTLTRSKDRLPVYIQIARVS